MKALETTGVIDDRGNLSLDQPVQTDVSSRVRVIILFPEAQEQVEDDLPVEEIKASLRRSLQQAKAGQRIPLFQAWQDIEAE